jgi:hypothetical protein
MKRGIIGLVFVGLVACGGGEKRAEDQYGATRTTGGQPQPAEVSTAPAPPAPEAAQPPAPQQPPTATTAAAEAERERAAIAAQAERIQSAIHSAMASDKAISAATRGNVKIEVLDGNKVTLRGTVKSEQEKRAIEAIAKRQAGVTDVDDKLEVKK